MGKLPQLLKSIEIVSIHFRNKILFLLPQNHIQFIFPDRIECEREEDDDDGVGDGDDDGVGDDGDDDDDDNSTDGNQERI